ncbi:MAG: hypothetical protein KJ645_04590 [Planctomycetes bacterium]|nr:hypothetical protein [Planctomycetota bacterium]
MVCWHGYNQTCLSVSIDSPIDEECENRGWVYLSITGVNQVNFGYLKAQIHCNKAIKYLIEDLLIPIDRNRIYMAGFSMGGGAAVSYACRHLSVEEDAPYPVAGLVLVSPAMDWTYAYNQCDPGVMTYLPIYLDGTPEEVPFAYKQISSLYILGHNYWLDDSMGQNLAHNMPIFLTYADNDPLSYVPVQNNLFSNMLNNLGANLLVDHYVYAENPHSWTLLDVGAAFDFIENYSLEDQETENLTILADRSAKFYWAEIVMRANDSFARLTGSAISELNRLIITEAANMNSVTVDFDYAGFDDGKNLRIDYHSTPTQNQALRLAPISEPTYMVDGAGVLEDYSYDAPSEQLSIEIKPPSDDLFMVSFEPYNLILSADTDQAVGKEITISMSGGDPYDPYLLFLALEQVETPVSWRHLLINPLYPTVWIYWSLDGEGNGILTPTLPDDPALVGLIVYEQFLTYDTEIKEISNLQVTQIKEKKHKNIPYPVVPEKQDP